MAAKLLEFRSVGAPGGIYECNDTGQVRGWHRRHRRHERHRGPSNRRPRQWRTAERRPTEWRPCQWRPTEWRPTEQRQEPGGSVIATGGSPGSGGTLPYTGGVATSGGSRDRRTGNGRRSRHRRVGWRARRGLQLLGARLRAPRTVAAPVTDRVHGSTQPAPLGPLGLLCLAPTTACTQGGPRLGHRSPEAARCAGHSVCGRQVRAPPVDL